MPVENITYVPHIPLILVRVTIVVRSMGWILFWKQKWFFNKFLQKMVLKTCSIMLAFFVINVDLLYTIKYIERIPWSQFETVLFELSWMLQKISTFCYKTFGPPSLHVLFLQIEILSSTLRYLSCLRFIEICTKLRKI